MQSVPITTNVVSSNHFQVCSIQQYAIKFLSDLRQVGGFTRVLRFPPPIKLTANDITEILLKVALNTIDQTIHVPMYIVLLHIHYKTKHFLTIFGIEPIDLFFAILLVVHAF